MPKTVDGHAFLADILADPAAPTAAPSPTGVTVEFSVKRFVLQLLLEKAITVVPTRDVMAVLKCFQIEATPGRLRVVATDLELSLIAATEMVAVEHSGVAVLPARKLLDIVRQAGDSDVHIRIANLAAAITIGRTTWRLRLQGGDDYPPMPAIADVTFATVNRHAFVSAIQAVRYAACRDNNRTSLMVVDIRNGRMTACDGSRFQQAPVADLPFDLQIPIGAVDDLLKLLKASDLTDIHIGESGHHLIFRIGGDVLIVAKLMAAFPDMESQLLRPALENKHRLTVDRGDLIDAVRRVRITADPETSAIRLTMTPGTLTIAAADKFGSSAEETIDAGWDAPPRTIVVNHTFLAEMVAMCGSPTLTFVLGDDTRTRKAPILLRDPAAGTVGVVQQMLGDWIGA